MKVLLKVLEHAGTPATEQLLDLASLRIGRGTDQHIVLSDLRVALAHAEISSRKGLMGTVYRIQATARHQLWINGRQVSSDDLSVGDEIDIGRHRLTVGKAPQGADLCLLLSERFAAHDERSNRRQALKLSLQDSGWSKRGWAWGLFLLVLIPGLLLPVWLSHRDTAAPTVIDREHLPKQSPGLDIIWNSGPLSSAHHMLQNDCTACHRKPFEQANDAGCRSCHTNLREHPGSKLVLQQSPFDTQRCTDCHREHNGLTGLVPRDNKTCTACHAEPAHLPGKALKPVRNFSSSHPAFSLSLAKKQGDGFVWDEVAQDTPQAQHQDTGLKFPHALHLAAKGIDAPGGTKQMQCSDCHTPNADRSGFLPVTMQTHCADCHRLDFDPGAPARELPHGKPAAVVQIVRDYYAGLALSGHAPPAPQAEGVVIRRRADSVTANTGPAFAPTRAWATARADVALRDVFERRTCFYCHSITKDGPAEAPWRIAPVAAQQLALKASLFPHSAHSTETCTSCHAAERSEHSEDVLLPTIERCRDCHGDTGSMKQTPSPCQSCHGYHSHDLKEAETPAAALRPKTAAPATPAP